MKESIRLYEIEKIELLNPKDSNKPIYSSSFANNLTPGDYGVQRFVTIDGEIVVMNLFEDGIPDIFKEIQEILIHYIERQIGKGIFKGSSVSLHEAYRYFADLSPLNNIWYCEVMYLPAYYDTLKVINKEVFTPQNGKLTYTNWLSLSEQAKGKYMLKLLDNPGSTHKPFISPWA